MQLKTQSQVLTKFSFFGGGKVILGNSNLKVPSSDQIFIGGGGILGNSKLKVPTKFLFGGVGWRRGVLC